MTEMLDQATEKYFDEKFKNINKNIDSVDKKVDRVAISVERIDGKVVEHGVRLAIVEKAHKDHIDNHQVVKTDNKWNIEMKIVIAIFALGQLMNIIDRFFPPSP